MLDKIIRLILASLNAQKVRMFKHICSILILSSFIFGLTSAGEIDETQRSRYAEAKYAKPLDKALRKKGLALGNAVFLRITKTQSKRDEAGQLEAFVENKDGDFVFLKAWDICAYSGELGPKLKQGDKQSPEGFYFVKPGQMNPYSSYHLSFNLGYPNAYDRGHGRTGNYLMVHGDCVSIGSYAMTNDGIEEIYTLMGAALKGGQPFVRVHVFPFPMTEGNLKFYKDNTNITFWKNLKTGWDWFEEKGRPPNVNVSEKRYVFSEAR
ncbi:L,D-transpeptidase family protein [Hellea balneolensis]|uniref:L,D-transpeptidase family protein n=1 Tax=Hellea balneolensis TaxID=287478 RepID=UPI00041E1F73|nr:murein L,D-transpeptidase family protein [Hellea balneolensis]